MAVWCKSDRVVSPGILARQKNPIHIDKEE